MDPGGVADSEIAQLTRDVDRIADGDLTHRVETGWANGELNDLALRINEFVRAIEGAIIESQSFGIQVSKTVDELSTRTTELETQSTNATDAVERALTAATQQTERLDTAQSELSALQTTLGEVAASIETLDSLADAGDSGGTEDSVAGGDQITAADTARILHELESTAGEIAGTLEEETTVSTEIADDVRGAEDALDSHTDTLAATTRQTDELADIVTTLGQTLRTFSVGASGDREQVALINPAYETAVEYIETNNETLLDRSEDVVVAYTEQEDRDFTDEVNIAGRQRMLSQRIAKTTLFIARNERAGANSMAVREAKTALQNHIDEFDNALETLAAGGVHRGIELQVPPPELRDEIDRARAVWEPFKQQAHTVVEQSRFNQQFVDSLDRLE